jgi:TRAP-type transport system small permease protein
MGFHSAGNCAERTITSIARISGYIAVGILILMMLLTVVDVFLRHVFNLPILGSLEITEFMMVSLAFFSIGWATLAKAHVLVDILARRLSSRTQARVNIPLHVLYLALYVFIAWQSALEALNNWRMDERSIVLEIPVFPFYFMVAIGCAVVSLVLLLGLVKLIAEETRREPIP